MMSKHIPGRIIGHIDPIEGAHSIALMIATDGVTFEVGSEVDVYPGHEERLTEAEWLERSKPQASAELIERARALRDQMGTAACEWAARLEDGDPLTEAPAVIRDLERQAHRVVNLLAAVEAGDARTPVPPEVLAALEKAATGWHADGEDAPFECGTDLNAAVLAALPHLRPEAGERLTREEAWQELREAIERMAAAHGDRPGNVIVEWSGREWIAAFEAGSKAEGGIACDPESPVAACLELAEAAKPTSDFAGMTHEERKAWLRERGRLAVLDEIDGSTTARLRWHNEWSSLIAEANTADEPDALLALCEAVAVKERGNDE